MLIRLLWFETIIRHYFWQLVSVTDITISCIDLFICLSLFSQPTTPSPSGIADRDWKHRWHFVRERGRGRTYWSGNSPPLVITIAIERVWTHRLFLLSNIVDSDMKTTSSPQVWRDTERSVTSGAAHWSARSGRAHRSIKISIIVHYFSGVCRKI